MRTVSDNNLASEVERAETVLSTPGVTEHEWDAYAGGPRLEHLAYLQRIAEREGFGLGYPPPVASRVRAINRDRRSAQRALH